MSIAEQPLSMSLSESAEHDLPESRLELLTNVIDQVAEKITPVWPLQDYIAVNPFAGVSDRSFLQARHDLRKVSQIETLMPLDYFRSQFASGRFAAGHIETAIREMDNDPQFVIDGIDVDDMLAVLNNTTEAESNAPPHGDEQVYRSIAASVDREHGTHWSRLVGEEVSKQCALHYDLGQAVWANDWRELPLYQAWQQMAGHDRSFEVLGVKRFRRHVASLPGSAIEALGVLLAELNVPENLHEKFLLCQAFTLPGWSAWTRYQDEQVASESPGDFAGLLAIRLAHEVALAKHYGFAPDWDAALTREQQNEVGSHTHALDIQRRAILTRALEIAFRSELLSGLEQPTSEDVAATETERKLAQMVFCIDVRSERFRRSLETAHGSVATYGFAGFFGLPIEFVELGQTTGAAHVPFLASPGFQVREEISEGAAQSEQELARKRSVLRFLRKTWKGFQSSAISCFSFVEATGLFFGSTLVKRSFGLDRATPGRFDALDSTDPDLLTPTLDGLEAQGVDLAAQVEMATAVLKGIGITDDFARLVVFCGHGSETENNPLQAGLDCGACGGHSGEPNARFAAKLLNQTAVRSALAERGIVIPEDTRFVAALHNTTTDEITFFDRCELPTSHHADLEELQSATAQASLATRTERLRFLPGDDADDIVRRSRDWSEVRPEWGLAGNAAFVVGPRSLSQSISLDGRSFLHSYDHRNDPEFAVLEQVMTAPLVVAHWINMQYYASTVDQANFGSGTKTVHNVVGRFGIQSGNGGDLQTGLPFQSIHDGDDYQHHPLRLLGVLAAPKEAIETVIGKHAILENALRNGWMHLVAVDDGFHRYTESGTWEEVRPHEVAVADG